MNSGWNPFSAARANVISTFAYHNYDNPPDSVREAIWSRGPRLPPRATPCLLR